MSKKITTLGVIILAAIVMLFYTRNHSSTSTLTNRTQTNNGNQISTTSPSTTLTLKSAEVTLNSGKKFNLNIPQNYTLSVAAQGFKRARFMALSPDGRLFLGEMTNADDTRTGKVYVMSDFNEQTGKFSSQKVYLANLRNPNSVAFYADPQGQAWIYIALTDKLIRYPYKAGDNAPTSEPQTLATFPDTPHNPPQGYWHLTRTVIIPNDQVYVSIGSSCDSCEESEILRASIVQMNPDGTNQNIIASGLRNAVGLWYAEGNLFAAVNGSDKLGKDKPNDPLYKIVTGTNYGWPYCYEYQNKIYQNTTQTWTKQFDCTKVPLAWAAFPAHSAPLGFAYFDSSFADPALKNYMAVALHGSGDVTLGIGNALSVARENTPPMDFINGFLQNGKRLGRIVDVLPFNNHSFFLTDDFNGAIYYLNYNSLAAN